MPSYKATGRFRRNGYMVQPATVLTDLPEDEAADLMRRWLVEPVPDAPASAGYRRRDMQADQAPAPAPAPKPAPASDDRTAAAKPRR